MAKAKPRPTLTSGQLVCGFTVLAVGLFTAMFFRRDSASAVAYDVESPSIMQQPVERRITRRAPDARFAVAQEAPHVDTYRIPTAATGGGVETNPAPPTPSYHRTFSPVGALLGPVTDAAPLAATPTAAEAQPPADAPTSHTILDGDTLATLAERYLGSSARGAEIYEYNRDVLSSPDLLPIGKVLQIPPRQTSPTVPPSNVPEQTSPAEVLEKATPASEPQALPSAPATDAPAAKPPAEITPARVPPATVAPSAAPAEKAPPDLGALPELKVPLAPVQ